MSVQQFHDNGISSVDVELRCESNRLHAVVVDGLIEIKCPSRWCRSNPDDNNQVVLHRFTPEGKLVKTIRFRNPPKG